MSKSAGIFQLDNLLKRKLENSGVEDYITVKATQLREKKKEKIIDQYKL